MRAYCEGCHAWAPCRVICEDTRSDSYVSWHCFSAWRYWIPFAFLLFWKILCIFGSLVKGSSVEDSIEGRWAMAIVLMVLGVMVRNWRIQPISAPLVSPGFYLLTNK
jgi:hypothetical protein